MKQRRKRFGCLICAAIMLCCLICAGSPAVMATDEETTETMVKKLEAESAGGNFVNVPDGQASGGAYVGIDHTVVEETAALKFWLEFSNVPEATRLAMQYATCWPVGDVFVYIRDNAGIKLIGSMSFASVGTWDPFSEEADVLDLEAYIPAGSTLVLAATGSINIDYFELYYDANSSVKQEDGSQAAEVKDQSNAFISDLKWKLPGEKSMMFAAIVERDATILLSDLEVAGQTFSKGVCMPAGHFEGGVGIDVNIKDLGFTTFASYVGVSDDTVEALAESSVVFLVMADGKEVARSNVMKLGDEAVLLTADITGAETLRLCVSPAGDGVSTDYAVWGMAAVGKTDNVEDIFATPVPTEKPTQAPATPTPSSANRATATPGRTETPSGNGGGSSWLWYVIAGVAVAAIAVVVIVVIRNKKQSS